MTDQTQIPDSRVESLLSLAIQQMAQKPEPTKDEKRRAYLTQKNREWRDRKTNQIKANKGE